MHADCQYAWDMNSRGRGQSERNAEEESSVS